MHYELTHIADPMDQYAKILYNGDVRQFVYDNCIATVRMLGEVDGLSEMRLVYVYDGKKLRVFWGLTGNTIGREISKNFINSFSGDIYNFEQVDAIPTLELPYMVQVVKRYATIPSSVTPADNPNSLKQYFYLHKLEPNNSYCFTDIDHMLSQINEPVRIEITISPFDTTKYLNSMARYCQRLSEINQQGDNYFRHANLEGEWKQLKNFGKNVRDPVVDDIKRMAAKNLSDLSRPNYRFSIKISSLNLVTSQFMGSGIAENMFNNGSCQIEKAGIETNINAKFEELSDLRNIATAEELESVFQLPSAGERKPTTIRCHTDPPNIKPDDMFIIGKDKIASMAQEDAYRGIPLDTLTRHTGIFGTTGSGKSFLCYSLLLQYLREGIPFIVFEMGSKTDYRAFVAALIGSSKKEQREFGKKIRILTLGQESLAPFRFNPFLVPKDVPVFLHAENLFASFLACSEWPDPGPAILKKSIDDMYLRYRFEGNVKLNMKSFISIVFENIKALPYSTQVKDDIKGVVQSRLSVFMGGAVGQIFQCDNNTPSLDEIINGYTILEFAMLPDEARDFVTVALITTISEYLSVSKYSGNKARFAAIIEEAHNIIAPTSQYATNTESFKEKISRLFCKLLHEWRSKGAAFTIVDQCVAKVDLDVIKACNTLIVGKQRTPDDVKLIGSSMAFSKADYETVKKLKQRQFLLSTDGYQRPCLVETMRVDIDVGLQVFGRGILGHIKDCDWYKNDLFVRATEELLYLEEKVNEYTKSTKELIYNAKKRQMADSSIKAYIANENKRFFYEYVVPYAGLDSELEMPDELMRLKSLILEQVKILGDYENNL